MSKTTTVSKGSAGIPPTRPSRQNSQPNRDRRWLIEATTVRMDGTSGIERTERNTPRGRQIMEDWAAKRLQHPKVDYIKVEPVEHATTSREPGYLKKSERPCDVIGLP